MVCAFPAPIAEATREPSNTGLLAADYWQTPFAGLSCLLVEDGTEAQINAAVLEHAGATVTRARLVREALIALDRRSWELVVVDSILPDGSGYEVVAYATVTMGAAAILIISDPVRHIRGSARLERVFTCLDRNHTSERLVKCAEIALVRAGRREALAPLGDRVGRPNVYSTVRFSVQYRLSGRQRQVLNMLVAGSSPKEIAKRLALSPITIRRHAEELYRKCGVRCQRELLALIARATVRPA